MAALREFYNPEVAMQENCEPPREGLDACLAQEARFLDSVRKFHEIHAQSYLIDGDRVAVIWNFDLTLKNGVRVRREEMAFQRWEGDQILCERFFYDPGTPVAPTTQAKSIAGDQAGSGDAVCVVLGEEGEITLPAEVMRARSIRVGDSLMVTASGLGVELRVG